MNIFDSGYVGQLGENIASEYLIKDRFKILFRNYREGFDEIDIIARSFDGVLIFVEVKTMKKYFNISLRPEDNMTKNKFSKIKRACLMFSAKHPTLVKNGWRIDLIAILLEDQDLFEVRHYKNVSF